MLRFMFGVGVGIYVAQEYRDKIPLIKPIVDDVVKEVQTKLQQYKPPSPPSDSPPSAV